MTKVEIKHRYNTHKPIGINFSLFLTIFHLPLLLSCMKVQAQPFSLSLHISSTNVLAPPVTVFPSLNGNPSKVQLSSCTLPAPYS